MTVWIARHALSVVAAQAQRRFATETGGIILGYGCEHDIVVTQCSMTGVVPQIPIRGYD